MGLQNILQIVAYVIVILIAGVYNVIMNKKNNKKVLDASEITAKKQEVKDMVPNLMAEAEKLFTGVNKDLQRLDYCITKLKLAAIEKGVSFEADELENYIKDLCAMSKVVNAVV